MKKALLRTSKDIYDRLKWDHSIPAESVWIGYEDRMAGIKEIPFADFRPGGRIPWDRLQYFRLEEQRIWDRKTRLDRVFGSGDTTASERLDAQVAGAGFGNGFISREAWRWEPLEKCWEPAHKAPIDQPERIKVLTFNVLRTDFDGERIPHTERIQEILAHLRESEADIIALQEVQAEFYNALLKDPFFRDGWFFSDGPEAETLGDLGILIISRLRPVQVLEFRFPDLRPAIVLRIEMHKEGVPGPALHIASVHLPSPRREAAHLLRQECLDQLAAALPPGDATILTGDFNFSDGEFGTIPPGFRDLWRQFHPKAKGATFDPHHNPLAAQNSLRGLSLRLDRILLRDPDALFFPQGIELTATKPYTRGKFLSDHFGLASEIVLDATLQSLTSATTTHRSALCIIPPPELQAEIQSLRRLYDEQFERWMPHINLLYGFLPESMFPLVEKALLIALAEIQPFEISLETIEAFHHGKSDTVWLKADQNGMAAMQELQKALVKLFPQCTEQNRGGKFTPHLSLGKFRGEDRKTLSGRLREWNGAWPGLRFKVDRICLISRRGEEPFEVREEVFLGKSGEGRDFSDRKIFGLETALGMAGWLPGAVEMAAQERVWKVIREAHSKVEGGLGLEKIGSAGLGTALNGGDLDVLATGFLPRGMYFAEMEALLQGIRPDIFLRRIDDALVPLLKIKLKGQEVDLLYAGLEPDDHANRFSRSGADEIRCLKKRLESSLPQFITVVRALKAFAKARQIDDHAFGWPGGLAWTVLAVAFGPAEGISPSPEMWLEATLAKLVVNWDWRQPIHLSEPAPTKSEAAWQVHSCALPAVNITRNVTAGNLNFLQDQLTDAFEIVLDIQHEGGSWADLFKPPTENFPAHLEIRLHATTESGLESLIGWMRRHILSLILHWEAHLTIPLRAFSKSDFDETAKPERLTARFMLGIASTPDAAGQQTIHELLSEMEEKFIGWEVRPAGSKMVSHLILNALIVNQ
jgi:poly(A) polymerase